MKINNNILFFAGIVLISLAAPIIAGAITQPNDYKAALGIWNNIESVNEHEQDWTYPVVFIPVTGSATYTLTVSQMTVRLNTSQSMATNNGKIRDEINNIAASKGYNLKKIIWYPMDIANP